MKNISPLILLLTITAPVYSAEPVLVHNGFITGQKFLEFTEKERKVYVMGLVDGIFLAPLVGGSEKRTSALGACAEGMTAKQLDAILSKYLRENPEVWHQSVHSSMYGALIKSCPAFAPE